MYIYIYMYIYIVYIYGLGNPHKICDFWSKFQAVGFTGGVPNIYVYKWYWWTSSRFEAQKPSCFQTLEQMESWDRFRIVIVQEKWKKLGLGNHAQRRAVGYTCFFRFFCFFQTRVTCKILNPGFKVPEKNEFQALRLRGGSLEGGFGFNKFFSESWILNPTIFAKFPQFTAYTVQIGPSFMVLKGRPN